MLNLVHTKIVMTVLSSCFIWNEQEIDIYPNLSSSILVINLIFFSPKNYSSLSLTFHLITQSNIWKIMWFSAQHDGVKELIIPTKAEFSLAVRYRVRQL